MSNLLNKTPWIRRIILIIHEWLRFVALGETHIFHLWCWCRVTGSRERDDPEGQFEHFYWRNINPMKIWESVLPQYFSDIKSPHGLELRVGNIILASNFEKHFPILSLVISSALCNKITLPWTIYRDYAARTASLVEYVSQMSSSDSTLKANRYCLASVAAEIIWSVLSQLIP